MGSYVQIGDLKTWYDEHGVGEPLVLLHGGISTNETWRAQMPDFGAHFRVIAPEGSGQGTRLTSKVPCPSGLGPRRRRYPRQHRIQRGERKLRPRPPRRRGPCQTAHVTGGPLLAFLVASDASIKDALEPVKLVGCICKEAATSLSP
jgi:pimeloyl-ACP methyl ester carboxylesterase